MVKFKNPWGEGTTSGDRWIKNLWDKAPAGLSTVLEESYDNAVKANAYTEAPIEKFATTPNPSGKTINSAVAQFDWIGIAEKLNNPINWEMGSGEWVGEGSEPFPKPPTVTSKAVFTSDFVFPDAESINKWNDQVDEVKSNVSQALGISVALMTITMKSWPGFFIGAASGLLIDKMTTPQSINLDPGGKISITTSFETIRSTGYNDQTSSLIEGNNCIRITVAINVYNKTSVQIVDVYTRYLNIDPNRNEEDNSLMKAYELMPATKTIFTSPDFRPTRPFFKLIRTY